MKKQNKMKKKFNRSSVLLLTGALLFLSNESEAQTIQRQSIGSLGGSLSDKEVTIQQTVGQPYSTNTYYSEEVGNRPGFQQPSKFKLESSQSTFKDLVLGVYPNPAAYSITIESSEVVSGATLQIVDVNGKQILTKNIDGVNTYNIDCSSWTNGAYFITINGQNKKYSSKLIINK
ncbi:MAG: T9SS type A sorting domain-containing protein [Flavobacteriales bacterium]|nr:T9SS type A sorting domain-containing protein [Flavobacteriales bacterium]